MSDRLLEKHAAWAGEKGIHSIKEIAERQRRTLGLVRSVDDPKHSQIEKKITRDGRPRLKNLLRVCGKRLTG